VLGFTAVTSVGSTIVIVGDSVQATDAGVVQTPALFYGTVGGEWRRIDLPVPTASTGLRHAIAVACTEATCWVAGWAKTGEEVEVYVARGTETEVRAYDGEVESLTSATSAGIGIRVVVDHRLGFAWAGSLDESVLGETLDEARDNAAFATADGPAITSVPLAP